MAESLTIEYDPDGDILYVNFVPTYRGQVSDMVADMVVARMNPVTGRVENLEILSFLETARAGERIELPVDKDLMPAWSAVEAELPPAPTQRPRRVAS